jgi:NAD(P)-dependent dehydrogenase (short-subunit alcohol dehydrogenase family)
LMESKRSAVITGGSKGLGKAIAQSFTQNGYDVTICGRRQDLLDAAARELENDLKNKSLTAKIFAVQADISKPEDVSLLFAEALKNHNHIDVLINNASILGPIGMGETVAWADWVEAINVNLLGTMLMCREFIPHFKERRAGNIINISGGGAAQSRQRFTAYAASKAAVVRLTETLAEELSEFGISSNAVAPGALNTDMLDIVINAGEKLAGEAEFKKVIVQKTSGGSSLINASNLCLYLANQKTPAISGRLISAIWDPWSDFDEHIDEFKSTDIYTLRRIMPSDRGMDWGEPSK